MGKNGEKSYKTGEDVASSVKLLYLRILYRCIASKNRFLNRLCRFIARKICLYRQKCRFIAQNLTNFIASSVQENCCLVFPIASSVTKILANKIVSLYSIFFSKIVYLYRFKRYIFEYRCPTLLMTLLLVMFLMTLFLSLMLFTLA
jgi:hypothetical protein